ncbi:putative transport protein [Buchnera aphidicola str. Bp (Baizongia pistaciae)]|uniref:Uncharacterized membrane protein bbp_156 n=1 Tax=Buchnera aphidicola subsp. Baizongia pistaciae (strain Bp) TaxID=224915 RepID=Y156_BUCBP|nr:membrane protein [Buchnera aphidicola]Q89AT3.1 RecName: Full=Uncharacterized membrane protein bbp_156 [Buchnera aphidicola str. Bp (Baizongia pistaciae)]AAO26890.1 putative transport protein [Buchnera aphidicola str. Bp (Baizongia pistaciae)]
MENTIGTPTLWCSFGVFLIIIIIIEMSIQKIFVYKESAFKIALYSSCISMLTAILFDVLIWIYIKFTVNSYLANINFLTFISGYLLEQSLSMDNVAMWFFLFQLFSISMVHQRVILFYGTFLALVFRSSIIFFGVWLLSKWSFLFYVLSIILLFTGIITILSNGVNKKTDVQNTFIMSWIYKKFRITKNFSKNNFFTKENGVIVATPLFLVLILIELNDIIFSIDSIPAIFLITKDPFIIITSSFFSIIGLRSIYVILANSIQKFYIIKYGITLILIFISIKILLKEFVDIPIMLSSFFIVCILVACFIIEKFFFQVKSKN